MSVQALWRAYQAAALRYEQQPTSDNLIARYAAYVAWTQRFVRG